MEVKTSQINENTWIVNLITKDFKVYSASIVRNIEYYQGKNEVVFNMVDSDGEWIMRKFWTLENAIENVTSDLKKQANKD